MQINVEKFAYVIPWKFLCGAVPCKTIEILQQWKLIKIDFVRYFRSSEH